MTDDQTPAEDAVPSGRTVTPSRAAAATPEAPVSDGTAAPDQTVSFSNPLDALRAADGVVSVQVADTTYLAGTWSGLPRYECPHCGWDTVSGGSAGVTDHIAKAHPEVNQ